MNVLTPISVETYNIHCQMTELALLAILLQLALLLSSCGILSVALWTRLGQAARVVVVKPIPVAVEMV